MIRFLHTADWQIGMKANAVGAAAQRVRDARLDAARRVVELARERGAEMILLTGDIFEDNAVDRMLVRKVGEILKGFPGPVYIIPGNHDPLTPGCVWEHPVWRESANITVIDAAESIELDACTLFPSPLKEKYSTRDPTIWIDARENSKIAIGLAHGNVEGLPGVDSDYPISRDAPQRTGLDYLAIGHWHSFALYPDAEGIARLAYSGTHETTKFGERDSGNVLLVEIAERGAPPTIEAIHTGGLTWRTIDRVCEAEGALAQVQTELDGIENPDAHLVRVRLQGLLYAQDRPLLQALEEIVSTRFLHGSLDRTDLIPAPEDDTWIEALPVGPIRDAATRLREQAISGADEKTKAVATEALIQLFELQEKAAL